MDLQKLKQKHLGDKVTGAQQSAQQAVSQAGVAHAQPTQAQHNDNVQQTAQGAAKQVHIESQSDDQLVDHYSFAHSEDHSYVAVENGEQITDEWKTIANWYKSQPLDAQRKYLDSLDYQQLNYFKHVIATFDDELLHQRHSYKPGFNTSVDTVAQDHQLSVASKNTLTLFNTDIDMTPVRNIFSQSRGAVGALAFGILFFGFALGNVGSISLPGVSNGGGDALPQGALAGLNDDEVPEVKEEKGQLDPSDVREYDEETYNQLKDLYIKEYSNLGLGIEEFIFPTPTRNLVAQLNIKKNSYNVDWNNPDNGDMIYQDFSAHPGTKGQTILFAPTVGQESDLESLLPSSVIELVSADEDDKPMQWNYSYVGKNIYNLDDAGFIEEVDNSKLLILGIKEDKVVVYNFRLSTVDRV